MSKIIRSITDQKADTTAFEVEAASILREQRSALATVLEHLRPPITRPTDLHRLLQLDHKLSWRLFNAARAPDDRALASFVPGRRPMERFLEAALRHGAPEEIIARARAAFERFEASVALHGGGSRDVFENLVADLGPAAEEPPLSAAAQLRHRRNMFRASSLLFGRQARVSIGVLMVHPGETPGVVDTVSIKGMVGLHKTRRDVALHTMVHHLRLRSKGDPAEHGTLEPLDPREDAPESVGLLQDFCSRPLPSFRVESKVDGITSLEMVAGGLGASSEVTYLMGHICRGSEARPGSDGAETALSKGYDMPVELDVADVLIHESLWDEQPPEVKVYKWPTLGWAAPLRRSDLLPMVEKAEHLGRGPYAGRMLHVPFYEEMISYAIDRAGWKADEFRLFRCLVEYPVLHTRLRMVFKHETR